MVDRTILAAAAGFTAMVGVGWIHAARAAPAGPDDVSTRVAVADLNLGDQAGAGLALQRIRAAARNVCAEVLTPGDLSPPTARDAARELNACMTPAVNGAVGRLGSPIVTALNQSGPTDQAFASGR